MQRIKKKHSISIHIKKEIRLNKTMQSKLSKESQIKGITMDSLITEAAQDLIAKKRKSEN